MRRGNEAELERDVTTLLNLTTELARELPSLPNPATMVRFPVGQAVTREIQLRKLQDL
jgi:hypothetical protein